MPILFLFVLVPNLAIAADVLVFAEVLFRHGARAPSAAFTNATYAQHFPRGLGELTDMYWRSVNLARCLSSAATVGAAMFRDYGRHLHVPVNTQETGEHLLNYDMNQCWRETEITRETCPDYGKPDDFKTWPDYEEFVYKCLNLSSDILSNYRFRDVEAHINEYKNGLPLPDDLADNADELEAIFTRINHFTIGAGYYHDHRKLRLKFGQLMRVLLSDLENAWDCHRNRKNCVVQPNFKAYSTQDWVILGVLDSFGALETTLGMRKMPNYNSMIMIELWDNEGQGEVRLLYKPDEIDETLVEGAARNCAADASRCPIENFVKCCDDYTEHKIGEYCEPLSVGEFTRDEIAARRRRTRYAGP
ncbi:unnamed protein product [Caenorhabditis bovis]|uniref:Uncharacterized protein n=1 Tax=Caenorhabditis bovis TaxID=2654633 RepID=A0A8S1EYK1_9PELO|nr:unnamed protein product [Caenorhabditis bovis]